MEVEQWCIRVDRLHGEEKRRELLLSGLLDRRLKPRTDGDSILFPVTEPIAGSERSCFHAHSPRMSLPRHELIGGIAIMQEPDREGAEKLLASRPSLHTVLYPLSDVEGEFRTRRFEVLAGIPNTKTRYTEYGHSFVIDLEAAYFSARLSSERQRILSLMASGELVLDMFAGVGPFAISLANTASFIVASDINAAAVRLMVKNLHLNRIRNVLPVLSDAYRLADVLPWRFDRIVMNYPLHAFRFMSTAVRLCRNRGTIHCYALVSEEGELLPYFDRYPVDTIREKYVRSYSPGKWHAVYDITLEKEDD